MTIKMNKIQPVKCEFKTVSEIKDSTTGLVLRKLAASMDSKFKSATIPEINEFLCKRLEREEAFTPMAIKYHLNWSIARGLVEIKGTRETGVKGQPPKTYVLTRRGVSFVAGSSSPSVKTRAPKAKVAKAPEAAPVAQAA